MIWLVKKDTEGELRSDKTSVSHVGHYYDLTTGDLQDLLDPQNHHRNNIERQDLNQLGRELGWVEGAD